MPDTVQQAVKIGGPVLPCSCRAASAKEVKEASRWDIHVSNSDKSAFTVELQAL